MRTRPRNGDREVSAQKDSSKVLPVGTRHAGPPCDSRTMLKPQPTKDISVIRWNFSARGELAFGQLAKPPTGKLEPMHPDLHGFGTTCFLGGHNPSEELEQNHKLRDAHMVNLLSTSIGIT